MTQVFRGYWPLEHSYIMLQAKVCLKIQVYKYSFWFDPGAGYTKKKKETESRQRVTVIWLFLHIAGEIWEACGIFIQYISFAYPSHTTIIMKSSELLRNKAFFWPQEVNK